MKFIFLALIFSVFLSAEAQQTEFVDFKTCQADIAFRPDEKEVIGKVTYSFEVKKQTDSIFLDAKNMEFNEVLLNGKLVGYFNDGKKLWIKAKFNASLKNLISFEYRVSPKKALYFINKKDNEKQIWTQGQGKYTSHWLPSIDDMNDKIEFDFTIAFSSDYQVLANGKLKSKNSLANTDYTVWKYDMEKPMSSYLVALAIGKYQKKVAFSKTKIPLELYYYPEDSAKVAPTYRHTKQLFNFLENEIGVNYPWQNYKQVPVKDFLYSGMENTSLTIFSDDFMIDETSFVDKNYVNVNAHELAHQWFGNLVTETSGTHHWLQEGFATYYALLAEKDIFGDDYFYWKLFESAQQLLMQDQLGQGTALLNPKSSSLTFYQKGAWALFMLKDKVGEVFFKKAIKTYLEKHHFKNVETKNLIDAFENTTGLNLKPFTDKWLKNEAFPFDEAMKLLKRESIFIQEYLMMDCEVNHSKCDYYINSGASNQARAKIIAQVPNKVTKTAFKSPLKVRQSIATSLTKIPPALKTEYESLLNDASYITVEKALYNLWSNFPEERMNYLNTTKAIIGFNGKNVRLLWLVLALNTEDYEIESKQNFYDELVAYTAAIHSVETRQNAFIYLNTINAYNKIALSNLVNASEHHVWRFKKFARELLEKLSENKDYKLIIEQLKK